MEVLLIKLFDRIKELGDMCIPELRREYPENTENENQVKAYTKGMSRGELLEAILLEEFFDELFELAK